MAEKRKQSVGPTEKKFVVEVVVTVTLAEGGAATKKAVREAVQTALDTKLPSDATARVRKVDFD